MIVVEVLLAANLLFFLVCALRAPRARSVGMEEILSAVTRTDQRAVPELVPVVHGNVIPLRRPGELDQRRARAAHPSSGF